MYVYDVNYVDIWSTTVLLQYHVIEFDILILSFFAFDISGVPIVDDIVDAGEDVVDVVTDGTGLVGDALSDAYNEAADKVRMRNSPVWAFGMVFWGWFHFMGD